RRRDSAVLRPISTGLPKVRALKRLRSSGRRHGNALPRPIARLRSSAAISTSAVIAPPTTASYRHRRLDRRMRVVTFDRDVVETEAEDIGHRRVELQGRQRPRLARQLFASLLVMVRVQV